MHVPMVGYAKPSAGNAAGRLGSARWCQHRAEPLTSLYVGSRRLSPPAFLFFSLSVSYCLTMFKRLHCAKRAASASVDT